MRSKKKTKESPGGAGSACVKADQQQQQTGGRRRDVVPEALKLPSPLKYYPGTQMPMDGWFHACRLCRCWTAFSATATTGELVPLCRRCLPSAARKGQTAPKVGSQQQHHSSSSSTARPTAAAAAAAASNGPSKASCLPAAAALQRPSSSKSASDTPAKASNHPWSSSYTSLHQQQQQQRSQQVQRAQPGQAKSSSYSYKAGSRVFKPTNNEAGSSYIAPSQAAAAAAAATAALAPSAAPAAVPAAAPGMHHPRQGYGTRASSSGSSIPDRRSSNGDGYVSAACYKHLGPSNMHNAAAPADAYITCLGSGSTDNGSNREQSGSDMLGAITSLLSDLYNMRFSGGSSGGGSSSSAGSSSQEVASRDNSASRDQLAAPAAAPLTDNLPI